MKRRKFILNAVQLGVLAWASPGNLYANEDRDNAAWQIKQFKDKGLAHFSYAVLVGKKIWLIDPGRDPQQYFQFAKGNNATIAAVIETHPHADFVSSHL